VGSCTCSVDDDGPGMATEDLGHVFDPFFSKKDRPDASGLGMFISYSIVQNHGGEIAVDSRPGEGFRVHIVLPVATERRAQSEPRRDCGAGAARGLRPAPANRAHAIQRLDHGPPRRTPVADHAVNAIVSAVAVGDAQAGPSSGAFVEIRRGRTSAACDDRRRQMGEPREVVVAVAFAVLEVETCRGAQVLLQRERSAGW
jgi:hypothetical protein